MTRGRECFCRYVTFFSMAFPLAPLCALVANLATMRTNAYKMCYLKQRPVALKASGIGVWLPVFEAFSLLAVFTNCGLIAFKSTAVDYYFPSAGPSDRLIAVFIFEHAVLAVRALITKAFPLLPARVREREDEEAFIARTAAEAAAARRRASASAPRFRFASRVGV